MLKKFSLSLFWDSSVLYRGQSNFNWIALLRSSLQHPRSIYVTANMNTYFVESILLVKIWKHFLIMFLQNGIHFLQKALWLHISENATNAMFLGSCAVNVNILNKTIFAASSENRKKTNSEKRWQGKVLYFRSYSDVHPSN